MSAKTPICILGSNSFAGATLAKFLLERKFQVLGVSRSPISLPTALLIDGGWHTQASRFEQININQDLGKLESLLDSEKPQYIFDFAGQGMVAESWLQPEQWLQTNLVSKIKLLDILRSKSWLCKYIRASTPEVYGSHIDKIVEDASYAPTTPYAISHAAMDMALRAYHERYNFPAVIGRFANFYGPGQQLYRIIPKTVLSAIRGLKLPLHGGGLSERSFLHSDDLNSALLALAERGAPGQIYNFSSMELVSIKSLVKSILDDLGKDFDEHTYLVGERPSKDPRYFMDSKKAEAELSWKAEVNLELGLQKTIKWFTDNSSTFLELPLDYTHKP